MVVGRLKLPVVVVGGLKLPVVDAGVDGEPNINLFIVLA